MSSTESTAPRFLTRDELLSPPALDERIVTLDGFGDVLCGEMTGEQRGNILSEQAQDTQAGEDGKPGKVDLMSFQRKVLAAGILDPESPREARVPLLRAADVGVLMKKLGGSKVDLLLTAIMELSGMVKAEAVKGNSPATPSGSDGSA